MKTLKEANVGLTRAADANDKKLSEYKAYAANGFYFKEDLFSPNKLGRF